MRMTSGIQRLGKLFGRRGSECGKLRELFSLYLEEELSEEQREQIRRHLDMCENCTGFVATLQDTIAMLQSLPRQEIPQELKRAILRICEEEGDTSG